MANHPKPQPNEWYVVRNSQIHGRGLYARKAIPKDTWIVEYVGERVDKDESDRRANALLDEAKESGGARVYMFILNDEWDIDGNVSWNTARLMNTPVSPTWRLRLGTSRRSGSWRCATSRRVRNSPSTTALTWSAGKTTPAAAARRPAWATSQGMTTGRR
nr:SET domain-containing protein-lysine N-methyltransferase [Verrucomicrobium spinosum]